jgi:hypothetical protein
MAEVALRLAAKLFLRSDQALLIFQRFDPSFQLVDLLGWGFDKRRAGPASPTGALALPRARPGRIRDQGQRSTLIPPAEACRLPGCRCATAPVG